MRYFLLLVFACQCAQAQYYLLQRKATAPAPPAGHTVLETIYDESLNSPYTTDGTSNASVTPGSTTYAHTGANSLMMTVTGWGQPQFMRGGWSMVPVSVAYDSIRFWARTASGSFTIWLATYNASYGEVGSAASWTITTDWREYSMPRPAGDPVGFMRFNWDTGTIYVDDWTLTAN